MTTEIFWDPLPEKFTAEIRRRMVRIMQRRAGGIFPNMFEDGQRYVYAQILGDLKTENKIVETYTKLRAKMFDESYIHQDLENYFHSLDLENETASESSKNCSVEEK